MPTTDSGVLNWSANFSSGIAGNPAALGLTPDEATAYAALQSDYATKYAAATDPATRGSATVLAKNTAKKALVAESRKLAMAVTNHPGVTDQQRHDLGLTVRDKELTPVPAPEAPPVLDVVSVHGHTFKLRLHNGESVRRAKPAGVQGATIFSHVGDAPPQDLAAWKFEGSTTKTSVDVIMPGEVAPGSKVWLTAFWFNRKSQSGPACTPVSTHVGFGGLSKAA